MKKLLLSIFGLMLAISGINAQTVTLDFTNNDWGFPEGSGNKAVDAAQFENGGYTITLTGSEDNGFYYVTSSNYLLLGKEGASLKLPAFDFDVAKIEVVGREGASKYVTENLFVDEVAVSTQSSAGDAKGTITFNIAEEYQKAGNIYTIKVTNANNTQITAIKVYKVGEGSVEPETPVDPEIPAEPTEMSIYEIITAGASTYAKTEGQIIATHEKAFLLSDGEEKILVYLDKEHEYKTGNLITITGITTNYKGLWQFDAKSEIVVRGEGSANNVSHGNPTLMEGEAMDEYLGSPVIKYAEYTGTLTKNDNYYNIKVKDAKTSTASISYPYAEMLAMEDGTNIESGDSIKVTGYLVGITGSSYISTMATKIELIKKGEATTEPETPVEPETPIEGEILTVAQVLEKYVPGDTISANVKGYIVGVVDGTTIMSNAVFTGVTEKNSNIIIADNADETNVENCISVQLPSGKIRTALNLKDNPDNYKKEVILTGKIIKYCGAAGLKETSAYQFTGATAIENVDAEAESTEIYDLAGRRIDKITEAGIYIINGVKKIVR